jgi:hypothetical protein
VSLTEFGIHFHLSIRHFLKKGKKLIKPNVSAYIGLAFIPILLPGFV